MTIAKKRATICIDVSPENMEVLHRIIDEMEAQLQYQIAEYDPHYNFDTAFDKVKEDE